MFTDIHRDPVFPTWTYRTRIMLRVYAQCRELVIDIVLSVYY
jgi:hypothetical protein